MKTAKFWMYLLSLLALALAWAPDARAASETVNGITWTYTVSNGKATLIRPAVPTGTTGAITIPSTLGGCPVTDIQALGFHDCNGITSVTIGNNVTTIGSQAFYQCSGLTSVTIGDSVTTIAAQVFAGCPNLASVTIGNGVTTIGDIAFLRCSNLTNVTIGAKVTTIGSQAFSGCSGLTSLAIPASVTSIGHFTFKDCNSLKALYVPESLRNSMSSAAVPSTCTVFYRGLVVVDGVEWGYVTDDTCATVTGGPTNGVAEIPSTLVGCSVVAVGEGAFRNAAGLTRVVIPDGVTTIGDAAFAGCRGLTSVTIPDSVIDLPVSAFDGCTRLWASTFRNDGGPQAVSLTVTNVVVHFVTQSVPSAAVTPATNATGIVNIIAEVTASNAVAIAQDWAAQYPGFEAAFGTDFTAALTMETGKRDGAGRPLRVWQDYVAGTDPTDPASLFAASIVHDAQTGDMIVSCSPELAPAEAAKRRYSVYGKANLADPGWTLLGTGLPWRASENSVFHFFRVTVEMR